MEIERKWHMPHAPELPALTHTRMSQSYLSLTPEVRIRKYEDLMHGAPNRYDLTIKSDGTLVRDAFTPPAWFGTETTEQRSFRMREYWRQTRLDA